jgi:hypothetical protein
MTYVTRELQQLDEIEDLLEAYAEARLSPSGPVLAHMRAAVVAEAALAAATAAAERRVLDLQDPRPSRWAVPSLQFPRRAAAFGAAAMLTMATGAAVLAAPPGSPFYEARVAIEAAFLPTQIDARLASHEEHLAQRLVEAQAAASSGDPAALSAALAAYAAEVDAALAGLGDNTALLAHLEAVLAKHVVVLTALEARVPEQASIDRALESSQKAVERIKEKQGKNGAGRPGGVPTGPNNAPGR